MDSNNPQPQPAVPVAPTVPVPPSAEKAEGNKMVLWFVIGLVVIIALVGGIYFFLSKQQSAAQPKIATQTPVPVPTPPENLENDLNNINVDTATTSSDFNLIDQDLQQL